MKGLNLYVEQVLAFSLLILFSILAVISFNLPSDARLYPLPILIILIFLNILLCINSFKEKGESIKVILDRIKKEETNKFKSKRFAKFSLGTISFLVLFPIVGFYSTLFVYLLLMTKALGAEMKASIFTASGVVLAFYLLFSLYLRLPLPSGIFL